MKTASYTLIPYTHFGTPSTPDGNYDGVAEDFIGTPVKAASYYTKGTGIQTISYYMDEFAGAIIFEGTLDQDPNSDNYFEISPQVGNIPEVEIQPIPMPTYPPVSENKAVNIEGNFTYIRVRIIRFTSGVISKVSLGY